jgi:hypothetical protein
MTSKKQLREWHTLYESLEGKNYTKDPENILTLAKDQRSQRAVFGLILCHATHTKVKYSINNLPYDIVEVDGKIVISGDKLPEPLIRKIYQMLSK